MFLIITVSQRHIAAGQRGVCHTCPIALALREALPHHNVAVYPDSVFLAGSSPGSGGRVNLPNEARQFVHDFDARKEVDPFSFTLELPDHIPE